MNTSWADLNKDGRRIERIIKLMETKMKVKDIPQSLWFAYLDRLLKATHEKVLIADLVLGVNKMIRKAQKIYA